MADKGRHVRLSRAAVFFNVWQPVVFFVQSILQLFAIAQCSKRVVTAPRVFTGILLHVGDSEQFACSRLLNVWILLSISESKVRVLTSAERDGNYDQHTATSCCHCCTRWCSPWPLQLLLLQSRCKSPPFNCYLWKWWFPSIWSCSPLWPVFRSWTSLLCSRLWWIVVSQPVRPLVPLSRQSWRFCTCMCLSITMWQLTVCSVVLLLTVVQRLNFFFSFLWASLCCKRQVTSPNYLHHLECHVGLVVCRLILVWLLESALSWNFYTSLQYSVHF